MVASGPLGVYSSCVVTGYMDIMMPSSSGTTWLGGRQASVSLWPAQAVWQQAGLWVSLPAHATWHNSGGGSLDVFLL